MIVEGDLEIGYVVALKSGGPDMSISFIEKNDDDYGRTVVYCEWFNESDELQDAEFFADQLLLLRRGE